MELCASGTVYAMWFHRVAALALLVVAAVGCSRHSKDPGGLVESRGRLPEEQRPLPTDPNVSFGTLSNGVKYVLEPMPNTGRATRLVLVVGAGSLEEREDERGFAHFVEHVAMDPAQRFGELAPSELLARLGATLDADSNAETHFSHTQYFLTLQGADPALTAQGLDALAGWASQVRFTPEAVERQRPIVLAELRHSDVQKAGLFGRLNQFLMEGLGIAERAPLGEQADLRAAAAPQLEAFYRRWYLPQSLTVVATGEFDRATLTEQIEKRFGALPPQPARTRPGRLEAKHQKPAFVPAEQWILANASEEQLPGGFAVLILQLPASGVRFEHDYRATLTDRYLCAVIEARLRRPPARGQFECAPARPGAGQVQLRLRASANPKALRAAVEAMLVELQRILEHGFLEAELRRAEPQLIEQGAREAQRAESLREVSEELVGYVLDEQALLSPSQKQELGSRLLATVNPKVLQERARKWLTEGRQLLAAAREDGDDSLDSEQALGALVREVRTRTLPLPREPELAIELMPTLPEPGKIVHTERLEEPDLHVWALGNGAKVIFKRGREGGGKALLHALTSARADEAATRVGEDDPWNRLHAPKIVQRSGAGTHDAPTLSRLLSTTTTQLQLGTDIDASASVHDLETTLQLLHLYLTAPRRDPQAFEQLLSEMREEPTPQRAFMNAMFPELEPRSLAKKLDLDAVMQAYQAQFGDVSGVQFVIVADLDAERLRPLVERYLASLPGSPVSTGSARSRPSQRTHALRGAATSRGGVQRVRVPSRPGEESQVVLRFSGTTVPSPEARIEHKALEAYLRLRLREVLREQLGGIYDVELTSGWSGSSHWHEVRFDCKPADVEKLRRATLDIITGIEQPGISDAELQALRAQHAAQFPRAFHEDEFWLDELVHAYAEGAPPRRILALPKLSAHITREALRRAARRALPVDRYVDAVWSPQSPPSSR